VLVVFDVDGTLVDSQAHILAAMAAAFAALGRPAPERAETLAVVGLSLPVALARLAPDLDAPGLERIVAAYKAAFGGLRGTAASPLYPGAREALDRLAGRPGVVLGVATGKSRRGLDHILDLHGLRGHFATLQCADDHPSKPHPAMLRAAIAATGIAPRAAAMVGDTDFDIAMGRAAGMATLGVTWGYHPADRLAAAGADRLLPDFAALDAALDAVLA
jgi:phosphoglycolate phosphatase